MHAQEQQLPARADLEQKLGAQIPLDLRFTDETGHEFPLRQYFGQRPVILQMGYNHCWLMCDVVTGALVRSLQDLRLDPGSDFDVVFVSIDPHETWQLAARKRAEYIRSFGRSKTGPGWHFLTGREPAIRALAAAVGFHYFYDPRASSSPTRADSWSPPPPASCPNIFTASSSTRPSYASRCWKPPAARSAAGCRRCCCCATTGTR